MHKYAKIQLLDYKYKNGILKDANTRKYIKSVFKKMLIRNLNYDKQQSSILKTDLYFGGCVQLLGLGIWNWVAVTGNAMVYLVFSFNKLCIISGIASEFICMKT